MHEAPLEVRPAAATPAARGRQSCGVPMVGAVTDERTLSRSSQHIHTFCACSLCDRFWVCATWGSATGASTTPDILGACATDVSFSHKPQDSLQTRVRVRVGRCMQKAGGARTLDVVVGLMARPALLVHGHVVRRQQRRRMRLALLKPQLLHLHRRLSRSTRDARQSMTPASSGHASRWEAH